MAKDSASLRDRYWRTVLLPARNDSSSPLLNISGASGISFSNENNHCASLRISSLASNCEENARTKESVCHDQDSEPTARDLQSENPADSCFCTEKEHCGFTKAFTTVSHLNQHRRAVHLRLRPHKCARCPLSFAKKFHLRSHEDAVHNKRRPFQCSTCSARFAKKTNRDRHERKVHPKNWK